MFAADHQRRNRDLAQDSAAVEARRRLDRLDVGRDVERRYAGDDALEHRLRRIGTDQRTGQRRGHLGRGLAVLDQRLATALDELAALDLGELAEARVHTGERQRGDAIRIMGIGLEADAAAHGLAHQMGCFETEMINHADQIGGEVGEVERAVVVVRAAVAARIPRRDVEFLGEYLELIGEILAPPADSVQHED